MPAFVRAADTGLLVALLDKAEEGDVITYEQMSGVVGRPVDGSYPFLRTALHALESESGKVFACERGVGFRRLPPADIVATAGTDRQRINRIAKRCGKRLVQVDVSRLTEAEKRDYYTHRSIQGVLVEATTTKAQKKIAAQVNGSEHPLAIARTLDFLK